MIPKLAFFATAAALVLHSCMQQNTVVYAPLTKGDAQQATSAFQASGTSPVYGHVYGSIIMNELAALPNIKNILVFNAQDQNGALHIVFKATDSDGQILNHEDAFEQGTGYPPTTPTPPNGRVAYIGGRIADGFAQQWTKNFQGNFSQRASVFTFDVAEFKKILTSDGAAGMFFLYGLDKKGGEQLVAGAIDSGSNFLWNNYLSISKGEKTSPIYPNSN